MPGSPFIHLIFSKFTGGGLYGLPVYTIYKLKFQKLLITCSWVRIGQHVVVPGPGAAMTPIPKAHISEEIYKYESESMKCSICLCLVSIIHSLVNIHKRFL